MWQCPVGRGWGTETGSPSPVAAQWPHSAATAHSYSIKSTLPLFTCFIKPNVLIFQFIGKPGLQNNIVIYKMLFTHAYSNQKKTLPMSFQFWQLLNFFFFTSLFIIKQFFLIFYYKELHPSRSWLSFRKETTFGMKEDKWTMTWAFSALQTSAMLSRALACRDWLAPLELKISTDVLST